jgi:hypothetical protein
MYGNVTANKELIVTGNVAVTGNITAANLGNISSLNLDGNASNILYGNGVFANTFAVKTYGSFTSNLTQTSAGANSTNYMTLNNTEDANGVSIVSNSQITVARTGTYNIQFSAQFEHDTNQTANLEIWLTKNGNAVANTNTVTTLIKDQRYVAAWNFVDTANTANTYYELAWASSDTSIELVAVAAGNTIANVAIPSLIVTVVPVGA